MIYEEATLLRFRWDGEWIRLKIRNHRDRWGHTFLCDHERLLDWLHGEEHNYLESNGYDLLKGVQYDDCVKLMFFWISPCSNGQLIGCMDTVHLDKAVFLSQLQAGRPAVFFSHLHRFDKPTRFDFSTAQATLQKVISDKHTRRALCKVLSQRVGGYCGDHVQVYNDFGKSFYLITTSQWGAQNNGGLVLHSSKKEGREYVYYGFHT